MKSCPTCQGTYPTNFSNCPQDGTSLVEASAWTEGTLIRGKYRIVNKLGQGGMGEVYKALHVTFDELRALKVISLALMNDTLLVKRFKHEAKVTRTLQHPNAVRVDDIDEAEDGRPFIVMEYIEGQSLKTLIQQQGPLPVPRVCSIVKQVALALEAAHGLGMVHRDIKPDNIVLINTAHGEQPKVLDFGIAKIKEAHAGEATSTGLTKTGLIIGTPQYMSPEQAMGKRGEELDGRSDLYSLGVVMYQMLTGDLPFKADTTMSMLLAHLQTPPTPIRMAHPELQVPDEMAALVMKTLEKNPDQRPASARVLIDEIERFEKGPVPPYSTRTAAPGSMLSPQHATHRAAQSSEGAAAVPVTSRPGQTPSPEIRPAPPLISAPQPKPLPPVGPPAPISRASRTHLHVGLGAVIGVLILGLAGGGLFLHLTSRGPQPVTIIEAPPVQPASPAGPSSQGGESRGPTPSVNPPTAAFGAPKGTERANSVPTTREPRRQELGGAANPGSLTAAGRSPIAEVTPGPQSLRADLQEPPHIHPTSMVLVPIIQSNIAIAPETVTDPVIASLRKQGYDVLSTPPYVNSIAAAEQLPASLKPDFVLQPKITITAQQPQPSAITKWGNLARGIWKNAPATPETVDITVDCSSSIEMVRTSDNQIVSQGKSSQRFNRKNVNSANSNQAFSDLAQEGLKSVVEEAVAPLAQRP